MELLVIFVGAVLYISLVKFGMSLGTRLFIKINGIKKEGYTFVEKGVKYNIPAKALKKGRRKKSCNWKKDYTILITEEDEEYVIRNDKEKEFLNNEILEKKNRYFVFSQSDLIEIQ